MLTDGTIIADRYEIISKLGDGGMGSVYKARQLGLERIIAVKFLHCHLIEDKENRERFEREGKILSRLSHQNLMTFFEFGFYNDRIPFIAMEFLAGSSLKSLINKEGKIPWERCCKIAIQVCAAMAHAHEQGIVHRDLTPNNVMLLNEPEADFVKVVDFGLARAVIGSDSEIQKLTRTGALMGTPHYMSPEQCRGSQVDNRSDIYSLACMLFESISGKLPFDSDNAIGLIRKHINDETPRLEAGKRSYPLELGSIIYKAMAKETENRYQSMTELESDLQHLLRNEFEQISAPVPINHRKAWNPAIFIALVASTLIIAFVLGFGFFSDPGFAAPMAGLIRGLRKEQSEQFASSYGQWLEKQNKPRGAELIYTSILSRQEKSALPPEEIADLWFSLAKLQFQLSETNLGCRSLIRGMQILVKLPNQKKLLDYGPRIESLIRANFQCAISPPVEPSSKEMLKKSAHHFSRAAQMSVAEQLWRLILFTGRKDVELQITKCCENAADLRDDGRRDEARACLNVAEGRIRENMNQLNKPWLMRLYAQLSTEWFHMREYDKSRDYVYKAYVLGESGAKPDLSTQAALARCNADLLNQEGKTDESLSIYKSAFDLGKQLLDDNRSSLEYLAVYTEKLIDSGKRIEAKQALSDFLNTVEPTRFNQQNYIRCRLALAMVEIDLGQPAEAQKQLDLLNRELPSETAELAPHFFYEVRLRLLLKEKNYPQFCQLLAKAKDELPKRHRGFIYILNDDLYALAKSDSAEVPWQTIQESCKLEALEPVEVVASLETAANLYSKGTMTEEKRIELLEGVVSKIVSLPISGQRKAETNYFQQHVVLAAQKLIKQHKYAETLDLLLAVQELEKIDKKYRQSARLLRAAIPN